MNIQGAEGMSPENLRDEINRGGRLVIYMYCVSVLVMTFKRPTEIKLIKAGHNPAAASWPYVLVSLLCGWWGFPWGPIYTIECLYRNLSGGVDVTDDVLAQLPTTASAARAAVPATTAATPAAAPSLTEPVAPAKGFDMRVAGLMLAAACLVVALGVTAYCYQQKRTLTVVLASGLEQPYGVVLNGQPHTLKPYAAEILTLPEGEFVLADAGSGKVVGAEQRFTLSAPLFSHLGAENIAIINPDRLAILAKSDVPYHKEGSAPAKEEAAVFSLFANQLTYFIPKPDYVIQKAPSSISMPAGTTRLVKTRLENVRIVDLAEMMETLAEKSGYPVMKEHLMLMAKRRTDEELLMAAARNLKPEDVRPFFQLRLAERPVLVDWHRFYQQQMEQHHPDHDLAGEYRGYLKTEPGNGALLYLLGRQTWEPAEQSRLWHEALAASPPCPYAHAAMGFDALCDGDFNEALRHYDDSVKAGVATTSLRHYRRQLFFALGRTAEILPEVAAARKEAPLDFSLADEEIRATYAIARDKAAAIKLKDAYLAAYKAAHASANDLADAEAFLQAGIAYQSGDLPAYAQLISRFDYPFYHFRAAVSTGKLAEAAKATKPTDTNGELLLYLLAQRAGDAPAAELHFKTALEAMKKDDQELRQVAAQLDTGKPDARFICSLHMNVEQKRILLTALGVRQPGDKASYFGLARKLNFNPEFPHQFLRSVLGE